MQHVSEILNAATKLQKGKKTDDPEGLSSKEIIQIARESGLDEQVVLEAIINLNNQVSESAFSWVKGTKEETVSETIAKEITDEDWNNVLKIVRRTMGPVNIIEDRGPHYECDQMVDEITYSHLSLTSKNGATKIEYSSNWTGLKFIMYFFLLLIPSIIGIVMGLKFEWTWFNVIGMGLAVPFPDMGWESSY